MSMRDRKGAAADMILRQNTENIKKEGWLSTAKRRQTNRFERRYFVLNEGASYLCNMKSPKVSILYGVELLYMYQFIFI